MEDAERGWTEGTIAEYQLLLDAQAEEKERLRIIAEADEFEDEIGSIANGLLGKAWLASYGDRLGKDRRSLAKTRIVRDLILRYRSLYEKKLSEGLNPETAHRTSLALLSRLSLKPEFFRHLPKPRSSLAGALPHYTQWKESIKKWRAAIQAQFGRRMRNNSKTYDALCKDSFLKQFPIGAQLLPQTVLDSLPTTCLLAATLACAEVAIALHPKRAYAEMLELEKQAKEFPEMLSDEELAEIRIEEERERRLRTLCEQFGPPPGLPNIWA